MEPGGRLPTGKPLKIVGHGTLPVLPGQQGQFPAERRKLFGLQNILDKILLVRSPLVKLLTSDAALFVQIFLVGVGRNGPDIAEEGVVIPYPGGAFQDGQDNVPGQILRVLPVGHPRKRVSEDGLHVLFHQCRNLFLFHSPLRKW